MNWNQTILSHKLTYLNNFYNICTNTPYNININTLHKCKYRIHNNTCTICMSQI